MTALAAVDTADIAVVYGRQSHDKKTSIEQQATIGRRVVDEQGWRYGGTYTDGSSASRFATKERPDWNRLLADLDAGRFGVLVLWEPSRGDRRLSTWAAMLETCADRGVRIYVVSHERLYDPRNGRDWKALAEDGTDSAYESEKTSKRVRRDTDARAEDGRPHGMRAYGYDRVAVLDERGQAVGTRDVINAAEAGVVRETARRILGGESMRSVVADLNRRNVPTPKGWRGVPFVVPSWSSTSLRQVMLRDRNAGLRRHRGQRFGAANWEPIYDEGTHDRVLALLRDPSRTTGASNKGATRRHLLSGIARCGRCGGPMRVTPGGRQAPAYQCGACLRVRRKKENVDAVVVAAVVERLARPDAIRALAAGDPGRAEELTRSIAEAEARMDLAADGFADGTITGDQLQRINAKLRPQVTAWRAARAACAPQDGLLDLAGDDAAERWADAVLDVQRMVIAALMTVTVLPVGPGQRFDPSNVVGIDGGLEVGGQVRIVWKG